MTNQDSKRRTSSQPLRAIPSTASLAEHPAVVDAASGIRRDILITLVQHVVASYRQQVLATGEAVDADEIVLQVRREIERLSASRLARLINATGVVIHTNLGRAPVSIETARAMSEASASYVALELELDSGRRGGRMSEISRLLSLLTGAEASLVVNNNAAAVLLVLSALCRGRGVVLSRSQAVEIGGGFRIPDVLAQSGARLVEVGTTNRTYASDYERAIDDDTAALLSVHWSNFKIIGFTAQPTVGELAEVAHRHGRLLIEDLGSGSILDTVPYGLDHEPTVGESLAAGADIVCFSGDKLLGGPQAGIIAGSRGLVSQVAAHPLARALRADKTVLAGVAQTLRHYLRGEATTRIPVWQMISAEPDELRRRCMGWLERLNRLDRITIVETQAAVGGGSLPGETLPSYALAIDTEAASSLSLSLDGLAGRLRASRPAVMPRIEADRLLIDARTILPDQDNDLIAALNAVFAPVMTSS